MDNESPLDCQRCKKLMRIPIRLECQHYYCLECLEDRTCFLCGHTNVSEFGEDPILAYLLSSLQETVEKCANCDQFAQPMYFCETCQQPLCVPCKTITHNAKIFNKHHIVEVQEYGRIRGETVCSRHGCPFILYCLESKSLMCVECFNSSTSERKQNFVNVDLAYRICCDKLEKYALKLRDFHDDLNEQIELRNRVLSEFDEHSQEIKNECEKQCNELIKQIEIMKGDIIKKINEDKAIKTQALIDEVQDLGLLEGPVKVNLLSTSIFCAYASKIDLLSLYSDLHRFIKHTLSKRIHTQKAKSVSLIDIDLKSRLIDIFKMFFNDDYKLYSSSHYPTCEEMFSELHTSSLQHDSIIFSHRDQNLTGNKTSTKFGDNLLIPQNEAVDSNSSCNGPYSYFQQCNLYSDQEDTYFNDLLNKIDCQTIELTNELSSTFTVVSTFQRDITHRRRFIDGKELEQITTNCANLWRQICCHHKFIQHDVHPKLRQYWRKKISHIQNQQIIVREKVQELLSIQKICQNALGAVNKLRPFAIQMTTLVNIVHMKYASHRGADSPTASDFDNIVTPMDDVCNQIKSIEPNSQERLSAIEQEAEKRRIMQQEEWDTYTNQQEAIVARKQLKEVRQKRNRYCGSPVIAEPNRDRSTNLDHAKMRKNLKTSNHIHRFSESALFDQITEEFVELASFIPDRYSSQKSSASDSFNKSSCSSNDLRIYAEFQSNEINPEISNSVTSEEKSKIDLCNNLSTDLANDYIKPCKVSANESEFKKRLSLIVPGFSNIPDEVIQAKKKVLDSIKQNAKQVE